MELTGWGVSQAAYIYFARHEITYFFHTILPQTRGVAAVSTVR